MESHTPKAGRKSDREAIEQVEEVTSSLGDETEKEQNQTVSLSKSYQNQVSPTKKLPSKTDKASVQGYEFSERLMALAHTGVLVASNSGLLLSPEQRVAEKEQFEFMEAERNVSKIDITTSSKRRKSSSRSKHEPISRKNSRGKLTTYQLRYLDRKYTHCQNPAPFEIHGLAKALHLTEEQVKEWFLKRRSSELGVDRATQSFEYSQRLLNLARAQSKSSSCWSADGPKHCCHCVQSFECFWPRSNLQTIRMHNAHSFL